jgi:hypothetical protein
MAVYAVKTDRMDITFNLSGGYIFVQQKWKYNWIDDSGVAPWTLQEKRDFHNKADKWIWNLWSSKAYAIITGNSKIAQEYKNTKFKINLDIKWVIGKEQEHWKVDVRKMTNVDTSVRWDLRQIRLNIYNIDYSSHTGIINNSLNYLQVGVAHEFGHTFGNSKHLFDISDPSLPMHGDEYKEPGLSKYSDDGSIMSVGNTVRQRHYDFLKIQLKNLINNDVEVHLF